MFVNSSLPHPHRSVLAKYLISSSAN
uniref:Uncharacterized protein n=1 Tax=Anguilla anguilla TaxID=7936 RepID=A0A0E9TZC3_ANGAN